MKGIVEYDGILVPYIRDKKVVDTMGTTVDDTKNSYGTADGTKDNRTTAGDNLSEKGPN